MSEYDETYRRYHAGKYEIGKHKEKYDHKKEAKEFVKAGLEGAKESFKMIGRKLMGGTSELGALERTERRYEEIK